MSRKAVAAELQSLLEQLQRLAAGAERLAANSGLVSPGYFRGMQTMVAMASGELDQKGLLTLHDRAVAAPVDMGHG